MKYVDDTIKLSPYRQFCCPVSLISVSSSVLKLVCVAGVNGEGEVNLIGLPKKRWAKMKKWGSLLQAFPRP